MAKLAVYALLAKIIGVNYFVRTFHTEIIIIIP